MNIKEEKTRMQEIWIAFSGQWKIQSSGRTERSRESREDVKSLCSDTTLSLKKEEFA